MRHFRRKQIEMAEVSTEAAEDEPIEPKATAQLH